MTSFCSKRGSRAPAQVRRDRAALGPEPAQHHQRPSGLSKIEAGKLELENVDIDLRRTIEDVVDLLASAPMSRTGAACSIPADLVTHVRGDPLRLGQILNNLVATRSSLPTRLGRNPRGRPRGDAQNVTMRFEVTDTVPASARQRNPASSRVCPSRRVNDPQAWRLPALASRSAGSCRNDGGNIHVESALGAAPHFGSPAASKSRKPQ